MLGQLHSPLIPVSTVSIPERGGVGGIHRPAEAKCEQITKQFL